MAQLVKHLPSAQIMIPGSWVQALNQAPCSAGSLLLPLFSVPPPAHALSLLLLFLSQINFKKNLKKSHKKSLKTFLRDAWVAQSVKYLPSAQVMILESWDPAQQQAPWLVGSLRLLSTWLLPLHSCSLSLI